MYVTQSKFAQKIEPMCLHNLKSIVFSMENKINNVRKMADLAFTERCCAEKKLKHVAMRILSPKPNLMCCSIEADREASRVTVMFL